MPCLDGGGTATARAVAARILAVIWRPEATRRLPPSLRYTHAGKARSTGMSSCSTVLASALMQAAEPKGDGMDRFESGLPMIGRRPRSNLRLKTSRRCWGAEQPAHRPRPTRFQELKKNQRCADADKAAGHQMKELES